MIMTETILEMTNITKVFPGVKALNNVELQVNTGEIHALIGENGAGKSTLMKVLSGVHPCGTYDGNIMFANHVCEFKNINDSEALGIVIIHQELALIPELSIAENIFLGNERAKRGIIDWNDTIVETRELLKKVGLKVDPQEKVSNISVSKQQLVEIAKALSKEVKLLILDEPTAALNEEDSENLLQLMLTFKKQGITSILISHKLKEVLKVSDHITVLRDGQSIKSFDAKKSQVTEGEIIKHMVGRELSNLYPERSYNIKDEIAFEVKDWSVYHPTDAERKILHNIHLNIKRGEIIGIAGLMGAGRTELAMSIFGKAYGRKITGQLYKNGKEIILNQVDQAIKNGLAYVSEDRQQYGLILIDSVKKNLTLANLKQIANKGILDRRQEMIEAETLRTKINIRTPTRSEEHTSELQSRGHLVC